MTKILHFIKLRTYCTSPSQLLLQKSSNPFKKEVKLPRPLPSDFTQKFVDDFKKPIVVDGKRQDVLLMDKQNVGWLVWGKEVTFYQVPPEDFDPTWDSQSLPALERVRSVLTPDWWSKFGQILAQEHNRDYLANDNCVVIKSIFQILLDSSLETVIPIIEQFMLEQDRHKQRAAAEMVGGIIRGSKHWSLNRQARFWNWFEPLLQKIFQGVTPDTQNAWEMMDEYVLVNRDPRRNKPLIDYVGTLHLDAESSEAFNQAKNLYLVGTTMKTLGWHFLPWADKYLDEFWEAIANPYTEVSCHNVRFRS
jgi:proteasome activator subunit 4